MKPHDLALLVAPKPPRPLGAIPGTTAAGLAPAPVPVAYGSGERPGRPCLVCRGRFWYRIEGCQCWWCRRCVPPTKARRRIVEQVEIV